MEDKWVDSLNKLTETHVMILRLIFRQAYSRETSLDEAGWTPENSAWGHCAVASLAGQDYLRGDLLRYDLTGTPYASMRSHYRNRLPNGTIVDFTWSQFGGNHFDLKDPVVRARDEVLDPVKYPKTVERYNIFRTRVRELMKKHFPHDSPFLLPD